MRIIWALFFKKDFDRIVMPTPYGQDRFINLARPLLKPGGTVHFYTFKKILKYRISGGCLRKWAGISSFNRDCGAVAPRVKRYVFDLKNMKLKDMKEH